MLEIKSFVFNPFEENTYILFDETGECIIVDPGCSDETENQQLQTFIEARKLRVTQVVNTHCHIDHVLGNRFVKHNFGAPLFIPAGEETVLKAAEVYAPNYGFHGYVHEAADGLLLEGNTVKVGSESFTVLSVPGHSPGHVAFYNEKNSVLIGGDVLFYNSIGRTDLPGGNHGQLLNSIRTQLFVLPDAVKVYPGHGPETTIGYEKKTNPFCAIHLTN